MSIGQKHAASEAEARQVAEESRQKEWRKPSFMKEMFLGSLRFEMIYPFPNYGQPERAEYAEFYRNLKSYMLREMDPLEIDATGEFPDDIVERLAELGALGMNIPREYGGEGFSKAEYCKIMELTSSYEGSLMGFISPHQSVGVPECIKLFGTEEQKREFLTRCANGEVSGFALTESDVGSDAARVTATITIEESPGGEEYILNGTKLWCTNATVAKLLVVMARHKESGKLSALVVEMDSEGVKVEHRCRFMGLSALENGVVSFTNVRVPKKNLIGREGQGLRIALTALNTGRLSIPYGALGGAKKALEVTRTWAAHRAQWGKPIGKHEAIGHKVADMAATTFAMESVVTLACQLTDQGKLDLRLESAAAKAWNTSRVWEILDDAMQIRGGRGYEKESSLRVRGERPMPVERMMRDLRVFKIFEGTSEIMHLLMAREAMDKHLEVAGAMVDPEQGLRAKLAALPGIMAFYAWWYPTRWLSLKGWFGYGQFGPLAKHLRLVDRSAQKLARQSFHGMMIYQAGLERKQAFLFRWVDIAMELLAMSATISRVQTMKDHGHPHAAEAMDLADLFCRNARRKVKRLFYELWHNDDKVKYRSALKVLEDKYKWLESGIVTMEEVEEAFLRKTAPTVMEPVAEEMPKPVTK